MITLTEREFQRQVVDLARILGWDFIYHAQLAKWSEKGWPDLVLVRVRDHRLVFAELKTDKGKLTPRQEEVLAMLRAVSDDVHVWRPSDLDAITTVLR
jgi:VRR-NUC domain